MIVLVIILFAVFLFGFFFALKVQSDIKHNHEILNCIEQIAISKIQSSKPFSISEHYDRIEKASLDILKETENKQDYKITLWIGLDGLQLNDDGSTQWIKRKEDKPKEIRQQLISGFSGLQNANTSILNSMFQSTSSIQDQLNSQQTQNTIKYLQSQLQNVSYSQMQYLQTQNMINSIRPSYITAYSYYSMLPYYSITQCCCNYGFNNVKW